MAVKPPILLYRRRDSEWPGVVNPGVFAMANNTSCHPFPKKGVDKKLNSVLLQIHNWWWAYCYYGEGRL